MSTTQYSEPVAQAFWMASPGVGVIRDTPLVPPQPDHVLVRALYSGISRGTEALVFGGRVPPGEYAAMRAPFQEGDFPGPLKYGYSSVGVVTEGPADLRHRQVFCLYPHQTHYRVPAGDVVALPPGLPAGRAVLAANMETALNAVWDARAQPGDRVTVVGAGTVGMLSAWLLSGLPACELELVDTDPGRRQAARRLGMDLVAPGEAQGGRDLVLHATGNPDGLALALKLAGREATVVELSWYGDAPVALPLGEGFHSRRLRIISSQVGQLPVWRRPRWTHRRRLRTALKLLCRPELDCLISAEREFRQLPQVMARLQQPESATFMYRIRYP